MATSKKSEMVASAVEGAIEELKKRAFFSFERLEASPAQFKEFIKALEQTAEEGLLLAKALKGSPPDGAAKILRSSLLSKRTKMIETALQIETYVIEISKKQDGVSWMTVTQKKKPILVRKLDTLENIELASKAQSASIVIEAILLVMQIVGIVVVVSEFVMIETAEETVAAIASSSQLQKSIDALKKEGGIGSQLDIAKAVYELLKECHSTGILLQVVKSLCRGMKGNEYLTTAGTVTIKVLEEVAVLIPELVLAITSADNFIQKLRNLNLLDTLKNEFPVAANK